MPGAPPAACLPVMERRESTGRQAAGGTLKRSPAAHRASLPTQPLFQMRRPSALGQSGDWRSQGAVLLPGVHTPKRGWDPICGRGRGPCAARGVVVTLGGPRVYGVCRNWGVLRSLVARGLLQRGRDMSEGICLLVPYPPLGGGDIRAVYTYWRNRGRAAPSGGEGHQ
jgi:hypothetical protein